MPETRSNGGEQLMGIAIISDPQSRANLLREMLRLDPALREAGAQVEVVEGTNERLRVRVDHGGRERTFECGPEWTGVPLEELKTRVTGGLVGTRKPGWRPGGAASGPPGSPGLRTPVPRIAC